tara:strand:- start:2254 stop:3183 length:930 start_codon:yes stop_codon:yes gene_type:complete
MKILIELPTWLGDTVMATPAIENLINHFSSSEVSFIGPSSSIELLKYHPKVSNFLVLNKKYYSLLHTAGKIGKFDNFFSFRKSLRSSAFKLFVNSSQKYQFNKSKYPNTHLVEKYNNFINASINENYVPGKLLIHKKNLSNIEKSSQILGINPGASYGSSKQWYPEKFAQVIIELSEQYETIIFGSLAEVNFVNEIEGMLIKEGIVNYRNLAGKTSISELVDFISKLDLFITGDSGPMHIAASFQIPTVSIFGSTKDQETSQWQNQNSKIAKKNLSCQPCMKRKCPLLHHNCMKMIESKDIISLVEIIN